MAASRSGVSLSPRAGVLPTRGANGAQVLSRLVLLPPHRTAQEDPSLCPLAALNQSLFSNDQESSCERSVPSGSRLSSGRVKPITVAAPGREVQVCSALIWSVPWARQSVKPESTPELKSRWCSRRLIVRIKRLEFVLEVQMWVR